MGVIQSSINNLLTTAAASFRLSPKYAEQEATKRGVAEATAKKAEVGALTEASGKAAEISRQAYQQTEGAKTYEQISGRRKALGAHIANLEKLRVLDPSAEIEAELQKAYGEYSPLDKKYQERRAEYSERGHKAAATKRQKQEAAKRAAEEAAAAEAERVRQSEQFRNMFTEGGRYK